MSPHYGASSIATSSGTRAPNASHPWSPVPGKARASSAPAVMASPSRLVKRSAILCLIDAKPKPLGASASAATCGRRLPPRDRAGVTYASRVSGRGPRRKSDAGYGEKGGEREVSLRVDAAGGNPSVRGGGGSNHSGRRGGAAPGAKGHN